MESGGLTGSGEDIRIRGQSSLVLQSDPIIIVDGIRQDNTAGSSHSVLPFGETAFAPSRLNDIDFSEVATIDVLKGPAASTEYGTDAANGVIVITTKHGEAGPAQWKLSGERALSNIPESFPEFYYSWGHLTNGTGAAADCPLVPEYGGAYAVDGPPYNTGSRFGTCVVDSVTHFNPLNVPSYSVYGTGLREKYDLSVGGGSERLRYFVGAGLSNEQGIAQLPAVFRSEAEALGFPASAMKPNGNDQRSLRSTTTAALSSTADLTATAAYTSATNRRQPSAASRRP